MDSSKFLDYLKTTYPERRDLKILNLKNITSGWETEIESFDLEWTSDDVKFSQALIVRIFPGKGAAHKAQKEFRVMKQLQDIKYPVPSVHLIEIDESVIGNPFMIMDHLDGGTLDVAMNQSDETREIWGVVFCQLFVDLHCADWKTMVSEDEQKQFEDPLFSTKSLLSRIRNVLEETGSQDLLPIVEWLDERRENVPCENPSITHNDFHGFNIMLDESENTYVIDWGAMRVTDSRYDLALTLLLFFAYGNMDYRNNLLKGYEVAAGKSVDQIEFFEVYSCLRRLHDISSSISKGAEELGMRPEAVQMMRESVGHIINVRNRLKDLTGIIIPSIDSMIEELSR